MLNNFAPKAFTVFYAFYYSFAKVDFMGVIEGGVQLWGFFWKVFLWSLFVLT